MSKELVERTSYFVQVVERALYQRHVNRVQEISFEEWRPKFSPFVNDQPKEAL